MIKTATVSTENFFEKAFKRVAFNEERKHLLERMAVVIADEYSNSGSVNLNFICTHNSRRSQLTQVWAYFAAEYFQVNIGAYSGGTEVTSFYRNTVKTLQKSGFTFQVINFAHQNPTYEISYKGSKSSVLGFSKLYNDKHNPDSFIAITTCNNADENCPFIAEALQRFHLPFVDPKFSDGTDKQEEVYLKINKQIAAEIFYLFSKIKKELS